MGRRVCSCQMEACTTLADAARPPGEWIAAGGLAVSCLRIEVLLGLLFGFLGFLGEFGDFGAGEGLFAVGVFGAPFLDLRFGDGVGLVVEGAADVGHDTGELFVIEGGFEGQHHLEEFGAFFLDPLEDDLGKNLGVAIGDLGSGEGGGHHHGGADLHARAVQAVAGHAVHEIGLAVGHGGGIGFGGGGEEGGGEEEGGDGFHSIVWGRY